MNYTDEQFTDALVLFLGKNQQVMDKYYKSHYKKLEVPTLTIKQGRKYIKIVRENSVHAFINTENGDILKPASWNAPAKHARGNIFSENNGTEALTVDGYITYL